MMIINAIVMTWLGVKISDEHPRIILFAIFYIVLNVVLSIMDQFGWLDLWILLLNLIILGFLINTHRRLKHSSV